MTTSYSPSDLTLSGGRWCGNQLDQEVGAGRAGSQLSIEDAITEAEAGRDLGMQRVTEASDADDIALIDRRIWQFNQTSQPWSANNLRDYLPQVRQPLIGARVRAAAMRKEMVKVGYEPSTLPSTHAHPIAVWQGVPNTS